MLTIVRRGPANIEKPTEIVRGKSARLPWAWDGLCFGVPFHETSREGWRDIVTNDSVDSVGSTTWVRDNRGNPALYMTTSPRGWLSYSPNPAFQRPSSELTAYVRGKRIGTNVAYGGILTFPYDSAWPYMSWSIQNDTAGSGKIYGVITVDGALNILDETTNPVPTTEFVSVFLRWRTGEPSRFDVLGERGNTLFGQTHGGTIPGLITYSNAYGPSINVNEGVESANWQYSQAMVWSRRLSDTEMSMLVADPFGWYSPRRETVGISSPYPLAAGGGEMKSGTGGGGLY